jgi:hypothetical protein
MWKQTPSPHTTCVNTGGGNTVGYQILGGCGKGERARPSPWTRGLILVGIWCTTTHHSVIVALLRTLLGFRNLVTREDPVL